TRPASGFCQPDVGGALGIAASTDQGVAGATGRMQITTRSRSDRPVRVAAAPPRCRRPLTAKATVARPAETAAATRKRPALGLVFVSRNPPAQRPAITRQRPAKLRSGVGPTPIHGGRSLLGSMRS